METSDKTARQLYEEIKANPTRPRFGFGRKAAIVNIVDVPGGLPPVTDTFALEPDQVHTLIAEAAENFAYAEQPIALGDGEGEATLQLASYRPNEVEPPRVLPNTTVLQKSFDEGDDLSNENVAGAETKVIEVKKGNIRGKIIDSF